MVCMPWSRDGQSGRRRHFIHRESLSVLMTMGAADNSDNGLVDNPIPGVHLWSREGGSRARGTRMLVLVGGHSPTIDTLCANEESKQHHCWMESLAVSNH